MKLLLTLKNIIYIIFFLLIQKNIAQNTSFTQTTYAFEITKQKVLNNFPKEQFPLKHKAALFLLKNLEYHQSYVPYWVDSSNQKTNISEFDYPSFEIAKKKFDSIKKVGYSMLLQTQNDTEFLPPQFFIDVINNAFEIWKNTSWYKKYTFEIFCEYILPYRNNTEPISKDWRKKYHTIYQKATQNALDKNDPISVCSELVENMQNFQFVAKRDYPQPALSMDQVHFRGSGNCTDLVGGAVLAGRALGLAISTDFTPYFAASSNAHYWNTVVDADGHHIPFNATDVAPYTYNATTKRLGKVLRYTFSKQKNSLYNYVSANKIPTKKLKAPNIIDVTNEYVETKTIDYHFLKKTNETVGYLNVFNKGYWKPIWWGLIEEAKHIKFYKMGINVVYLPAQAISITVNNKTKLQYLPEMHPILLDKNGIQKVLKPDFTNSFSGAISRKNEINTEAYNDFNTLELVNGQKYTLFYWEGVWKKHSQNICMNNEVYIKNIPQGALFKLLPEKPDGFERIFIIHKSNTKIEWF